MVPGSIPGERTREFVTTSWAGGEMVYTLALGASAARRGGSSPLLPTRKNSDSCFLFGAEESRNDFRRGRENLEYIARILSEAK